MTPQRSRWTVPAVLLLLACDSLPGALDDGDGGGGGSPPTPPAFVRIENHGPTLTVDSLRGVGCPTLDPPVIDRQWSIFLAAPGITTIAIPAWTCYDYELFATVPAYGYSLGYGYYTLSPPPGDTVVIHIYDPVS